MRCFFSSLSHLFTFLPDRQGSCCSFLPQVMWIQECFTDLTGLLLHQTVRFRCLCYGSHQNTDVSFIHVSLSPMSGMTAQLDPGSENTAMYKCCMCFSFVCLEFFNMCGMYPHVCQSVSLGSAESDQYADVMKKSQKPGGLRKCVSADVCFGMAFQLSAPG